MKENNNNFIINNKKKIIIIISLFIILSILILAYYLIFKNKENKHQQIVSESSKYTYPSEEIINSAEELSYSPIRITCGHDENAKIGYSYKFYQGQEIYCTFTLLTYIEAVNEIWADYNLNENISYISSNVPEKANVTLLNYDNKLQFILNTKDGMSLLNNFYIVKGKISTDLKEAKYLNGIYLNSVIIKTTTGKYYKYKDKTEGSFYVSEKTKYNYELTDGSERKIIFLKYNEALSKYEEINNYTCQDNNNCGLGGNISSYYLDLNKGIGLLRDTKSSLYNFEDGPILNFDEAIGAFYEKNTNEVKYLLITDNNEKSIIDLTGKTIKSLKGYDFDTMHDKIHTILNNYSIENNLIVLTKNNKKGIMKLNSNDIIIEFIYDDIQLYDNKYFKAKINNIWYLYDLNTNKKVFDKGYKQMFIIDDNTLLVEDNGYLYIKDFKNNNITDYVIEVLYDYQEYPWEGEAYGYRYYIDNENSNIIYIDITTPPFQNETYTTYRYTFNRKNNTITKE